MSMYSWIDCNTVSSTDPSLNVIQTTEVYGSPLPWDGWYRLEIAAIDCAGNRDSSPATHVFELGKEEKSFYINRIIFFHFLDTEAPIVGIQAVPTRIITDTSTSMDLLKNDFYVRKTRVAPPLSLTHSFLLGNVSLSGESDDDDGLFVWHSVSVRSRSRHSPSHRLRDGRSRQ